MGTTLGAQMDARRTVGFDYLRILLAVAVLGNHSFPTTYGAALGREMIGPFVGTTTRVIIPLFFALSGFLVASSLDRTPRLRDFLALRVIRIFPALVVETTLSALILGTLLTAFSLSAYFAHRDFWLYLLNMAGVIHFQLPGVFASNPFPNMVNASLWTVPYELECYIALSILMIVGIASRPRYILAILALFIIIAAAWLSQREMSLGNVPGRTLPLEFLAGVLLYKFRYSLPSGVGIGLLALAATYFLLFLKIGPALIPIPAAYAAAALGCTNPPRNKWVLSGDYSYGMYLYAFPIQQTIAQLRHGGDVFGNFILALTCSTIFAVFSWHCIEKPALKLKRFVVHKKAPTPPGLPAHENEDEAESREIAQLGKVSAG